jgi:hypothetical protein
MTECNVWRAIFETKAGRVGAFIHAEPEIAEELIKDAFLKQNLGQFIELSKAICLQHLIEGEK